MKTQVVVNEFDVTESRLSDIRKMCEEAQFGYANMTQQTYAKDVSLLLDERSRLDNRVNQLQDLLLKEESRWESGDIKKMIRGLEDQLAIAEKSRIAEEVCHADTRQRLAAMTARLALADSALSEMDKQTSKLHELEDELGVQKRAAQRLDGLLTELGRANGKQAQEIEKLRNDLAVAHIEKNTLLGAKVVELGSTKEPYLEERKVPLQTGTIQVGSDVGQNN